MQMNVCTVNVTVRSVSRFHLYLEIMRKSFRIANDENQVKSFVGENIAKILTKLFPVCILIILDDLVSIKFRHLQ